MVASVPPAVSICFPSSTFSKDFSSETTDPISFKFQMQPPGKGGKKVYIFHLGHMTKMTAMPIYDKNFLLQTHWANCLEIWYIALGS